MVSPAALLSALTQLTTAPIAANIGRGALVAVTQATIAISPIASRTVPTGAATTEAEVLYSVTTTLVLTVLPALVVLLVALLAKFLRVAFPVDSAFRRSLFATCFRAYESV